MTPIAPKRRLYAFLLADYLIIAAFYLLLALSGGFAFPHLDDLYTLNFEPGRCGHAENSSLLHTVLPQGRLTDHPPSVRQFRACDFVFLWIRARRNEPASDKWPLASFAIN